MPPAIPCCLSCSIIPPWSRARCGKRLTEWFANVCLVLAQKPGSGEHWVFRHLRSLRGASGRVTQINKAVLSKAVLGCALSVLRAASPINRNGLPALMVYETGITCIFVRRGRFADSRLGRNRAQADHGIFTQAPASPQSAQGPNAAPAMNSLFRTSRPSWKQLEHA